MFIRATKHYKGRFPLDAGGVLLAGFEQKQVGDKIGKYITKQNFPFVVECDSDGVLLVSIPPVEVKVFEDTVPEAPPVSLPEEKPVVEDEAADLQDEEADQPVVEEVATAKKKRK